MSFWQSIVLVEAFKNTLAPHRMPSFGTYSDNKWASDHYEVLTLVLLAEGGGGSWTADKL